MREFAKRATSDAIDQSKVPDYFRTDAVMTRSFDRSVLAMWRWVSHKGGNQYCQRDRPYVVKVHAFFKKDVQRHG